MKKNIYQEFLNFIFICLCSLNCFSTNNDLTIGKKMIIYKDINNNKYELVLFNIETRKQIYFDHFKNVQEAAYLFYDKGEKLLIFPQMGLYSSFYYYNILNEEKSFSKTLAPNDVYYNFTNLKDSLLIFNNDSEIFIRTFTEPEQTSILNLNAVIIGKISCSKKNILAVLYNSDSSIVNNDGLVTTFDSNNFKLIDLGSKAEINITVIPEWIGNWSPNGEYLIFRDSIGVKLLHYPSLGITELKGFETDFKELYNLYFLDNHSIVFNGISENQPNQQIYLYDLFNNKTVRITSGNSDKEIIDIYSQ